MNLGLNVCKDVYNYYIYIIYTHGNACAPFISYEHIHLWNQLLVSVDIPAFHPWSFNTKESIYIMLDASGHGKKRSWPIAYPHMVDCGDFRNLCYPGFIHFNGIFHYKPSISGYPHFRKPPSVWAELVYSKTKQLIFETLGWIQAKRYSSPMITMWTWDSSQKGCPKMATCNIL